MFLQRPAAALWKVGCCSQWPPLYSKPKTFHCCTWKQYREQQFVNKLLTAHRLQTCAQSWWSLCGDQEEVKVIPVGFIQFSLSCCDHTSGLNKLILWLVCAVDGLLGKARLCGPPGPRGPSRWVWTRLFVLEFLGSTAAVVQSCIYRSQRSWSGKPVTFVTVCLPSCQQMAWSWSTQSTWRTGKVGENTCTHVQEHTETSLQDLNVKSIKQMSHQPIMWQSVLKPTVQRLWLVAVCK